MLLLLIYIFYRAGLFVFVLSRGGGDIECIVGIHIAHGKRGQT